MVYDQIDTCLEHDPEYKLMLARGEIEEGDSDVTESVFNSSRCVKRQERERAIGVTRDLLGAAPYERRVMSKE